MKLQDIPQFPQAYYKVAVSLSFLEENLDQWDERSAGSPLILNPEWQRGHVWSLDQQTSFMEYMLKGGTTGLEIYFNCSSWQNEYNTPIYCLDGLQRITAARAFLNGEIKVFGQYFKDFEDPKTIRKWHFNFNMLAITNKRDLLKVYLDFNSGGTPHNPKELERIEKMISAVDPNETI